MRPYPGVSLHGVQDPIVQAQLRIMDNWCRDAAKAIQDLEAKVVALESADSSLARHIVMGAL